MICLGGEGLSRAPMEMSKLKRTWMGKVGSVETAGGAVVVSC